MKNKAVFLDRDGTINVDKEYVYRIEDFEFMDGAIEAIRLLNMNGYKVIVITNQSGIGRGYFTEGDVEKLHCFINLELKKYNARIDKFYFCPHHSEAKIEKYRINCGCRKPKVGLLKHAIKGFDIDVNRSYMIGDGLIDTEVGKAVGCRTILIDPDAKEVKSSKRGATWITKNLNSAVGFIIEFENKITKK